MLAVKFLQPPVGRVRGSVVVRLLPPGHGPARLLPPGPGQPAPAVCCPGKVTLVVRTLSNVSSLPAIRTPLRVDALSGSRGLLDPGTTLRLGARSMSGSGASSDSWGWHTGLAESGPVRLCEQYVMGVQQLTGAPWWLSIIISTVMVRTLITLPLAAYQVVVIAKVSDGGHHSLSLSSRLLG